MHHDDIGIVSDIAAGSSKVNDACSFRTLLAVCIDMAHYIVADYLLALFCNIIIDIIYMSLELIYHLFCDDRLSVHGKTKFHLGFCKSYPQLSPCAEFLVRRKDILHLLGCISLRKWANISVCTHLNSPNLSDNQSSGLPVKSSYA